MPRPKSPCGTYPAYRRHLRERSAVDAACRRAQQEHDAGRGRTLRSADVDRPSLRPVTSTPVTLEQRCNDLRARYGVLVRALGEAVEADDLYGVIDRSSEMEKLLSEWIDAQDDLDFERGYPDLPGWLRDQLLAARSSS
jgi:hypothetical protein